MNKIELLLITCIIMAFVACSESVSHEASGNMPTEDSLVSRGKYLVTAIGCADCHSPKRMGPKGPEFIEELALSGFQAGNTIPEPDLEALKNGWILFNGDLTAAVGPWGISYAANITSDPTGIGNWTEENFRRALRHGKFKGIESGRDLLPPMPWQGIGQLSDMDIKAVFYFLQSTHPVQNVVPSPVPTAAG